MMQIACDKFNYELLTKHKSNLKFDLVDNFGECRQIYDVIITTWKQICCYITLHQEKLKSSMFIVSQKTDASHNRRIANNVNIFNKQYNTNNQIVIIGDGIGNFPNHVSSPWSRFVWMFADGYLYVPPSKRTHWTCLMSKGRPHKDQIIDFFSKNMEIFNLPNDFVYDEIQDAKFLKYMFREIVPQHNYTRNFPEWQRVQTSLPAWTEGDLIQPYHRSRIELVPETATDFFFITEKSIKPIRSCIPFVVVGCKHFMKRLRQMGFKTFEPWIDESYDNEPDEQTRITMACEAFKNFIYSDRYNDQKLLFVCYHNQLHLKKIVKKYSFWEARQVKKIDYFVNQYAKTY